MSPIEFIKEIETKYNVKSINVNSIELWPFLRVAYYFAFIEKYIDKEKEISLRTKIERVKNFFFGFRNLFKKYEYILFSDTLERRLVDSRYIDKIAEVLVSELSNKDKTLIVMDSKNESLSKYCNPWIENIISLDLFHTLCHLFLLIPQKNVINNEFLLKEINKRYNLDVNYRLKISRFFYYVKIFGWFYKIYKPKAIFINCYYSLTHQAALYTAKQMGIKVVELQHGIISKQHPAYNVFTKMDKHFFPDYLFAFGDYVKDQQNYINPENVLPVGNMYLDYIKNKYKPSEETVKMFSNFKKQYKKIVAISSQSLLENKLIEFLKKSASLSKDILYIFVPRDLSKDYSYANFPENIIIIKNLNVYQTIKEADFHSTLCSTCALEAPALGVPNILININGLAKNYYSNLLTNRDITKFVDTPEEFVDLILKWQPKGKKEIASLYSGFYKENHKESLKMALKKIDINNVCK